MIFQDKDDKEQRGKTDEKNRMDENKRSVKSIKRKYKPGPGL